MSETRKLAAILAADVAGYSRLTATDEERTIARLRGLRTDLIDPAISVHNGHVVKRTGDGILIEFRSVVDAVRCAIEVQNGMVERNAGLERQIRFRIGIHLGDIVEEPDGDLMGDGVNIAARLEGICDPGAICVSEDAYRQVRSRIDLAVADLGNKELKNIPEPVHVYSLEVGKPAHAKTFESPKPSQAAGAPHLSIVVLPFVNIGGDPEQEYFVDGISESLTIDLSCISGSFVIARNTAFTYKGKPIDVKLIGRELNVLRARRLGATRLKPTTGQYPAHRSGIRRASLGGTLRQAISRPLRDARRDRRTCFQPTWRAIGSSRSPSRRTLPRPRRYGLYFQGLAWVNKGSTPEHFALARKFFERALALDSTNIDALIGTAEVDAGLTTNFLTDNPASHFGSAEMALTKALSRDPNNAAAHLLMGRVKNFTGRAAEGIAECERALALDPNLDTSVSYRAGGAVPTSSSSNLPAPATGASAGWAAGWIEPCRTKTMAGGQFERIAELGTRARKPKDLGLV